MGVEKLLPGIEIEPNASAIGVSRIAAPDAQPRVNPKVEEQTRLLGRCIGRWVPQNPSPGVVLRIAAWFMCHSLGCISAQVEERGWVLRSCSPALRSS